MCYWQLPAPTAPIFAALIERCSNESSGCQDIGLAKNMGTILEFQSRDAYPLDHSGGPGGVGPGGGGSSGGDGRLLKRKEAIL